MTDFACFFIATVIVSLIPVRVIATDRETVALLRTEDPGAEWQLQVRQASLVDVLNEVGRISGARMHYSALPAGPVTATCVEHTVESLLKCLLGNSLNLAFRYPNDGSSADLPVDIWILGSSLTSGFENVSACVATNNHVTRKAKRSDQASATDGDLVKKLRAATGGGDPRKRALAVSDLAVKAPAGAPGVEDALLGALEDGSPLVREQALFGLVRRQGEESVISELWLAMHDPEASVRMKALELSSDKELLLRGTTDADETVRWFAQQKLQTMPLRN